MNKQKQFKLELIKLLRKYGATLSVDIEGDTHGMSTDFVAEIDNETFKLNPFYSFADARDIEDNL